MKKSSSISKTTSSLRDHCVMASCDRVGVSSKEMKKMLALLGKRAAMHELAHNLKERPPKFR